MPILMGQARSRACSRSYRGKDRTNNSISTSKLIQSVSKSSELVTDAANILSVVAKALNGRGEHTVTHVSCPADLLRKGSNANFPEVAIKDSARWGSKYADALEESVMLLQSSQTITCYWKGQQA